MHSIPLQQPPVLEVPESKRILVSVSRSHVDLLVAHELRPNAGMFLLNAAADAKQEDPSNAQWSRFGAGHAIVPRMLRGFTFWIDGEKSCLTLQKLDVKPGSIGLHGVGLVGLARFRAELPESPLDLRELSITSAEKVTEHVHVEFRLLEGIELLECSDQLESHEDIYAGEIGKNESCWVRVHGCHHALKQ